MVAFELPLSDRVIGPAARVRQPVALEVSGQILGEVARAVVVEQPRLVLHASPIDTSRGTRQIQRLDHALAPDLRFSRGRSVEPTSQNQVTSLGKGIGRPHVGNELPPLLRVKGSSSRPVRPFSNRQFSIRRIHRKILIEKHITVSQIRH